MTVPHIVILVMLKVAVSCPPPDDSNIKISVQQKLVLNGVGQDLQNEPGSDTKNISLNTKTPNCEADLQSIKANQDIVMTKLETLIEQLNDTLTTPLNQQCPTVGPSSEMPTTNVYTTEEPLTVVTTNDESFSSATTSAEVTTPPVIGRCCDGLRIGFQCLTINEELLDWSLSKVACSLQGGQLASIEDPLKLQDYLFKNYYTNKGGFWVGGFNNTNEVSRNRERRKKKTTAASRFLVPTGITYQEDNISISITYDNKWTWLNGMLFDMGTFPWANGEPSNDRGDEHCLELRLQDYHSPKCCFGYNDKTCDYVNGYICDTEPREFVHLSNSSIIGQSGYTANGAGAVHLLTVNGYWDPDVVPEEPKIWFVCFNFTSIYEVTEVKLMNYGDTTHDVISFEILSSNDTETWKSVAIIKNVSTGKEDPQYFQIFGIGKFWNFTVTQTFSGLTPWVRFFGFFGEQVQWREDLRCGSNYTLPNGDPSICNPGGANPCCNSTGYCGHKETDCYCAECRDYRPQYDRFIQLSKCNISGNGGDFVIGNGPDQLVTLSGYWIPSDDSQRWFITFDFLDIYNINQIMLINYGDTTHDVTSFQLESSNNKLAWETVAVIDNVAYGTEEAQNFYIYGKGKYWKLSILNTTSGSAPRIRFFGFFGEKSVTTIRATLCAADTVPVAVPSDIHIVYKYTSFYNWIWNNYGSNGSKVAFWSANNFESGYCSLGDIATNGYDSPASKAILVSSNNLETLTKPTSFSQVWSNANIAVYSMNAPAGYTCLGGVAIGSLTDQPDKNKYCCVHNEYITPGGLTITYEDTSSDPHVSILTVVRNGDAFGLDGGNFLPVNDLSGSLTGYLLKGGDNRVRNVWHIPNSQHKPLIVYEIADLILIWQNDDSTSNDIFIWRVNQAQGEHYSVGDIVTNSYYKPDIAYVVKPFNIDDHDSLRPPISYSLIWSLENEVKIWKPNCPGDYVSLGNVATNATDAVPPTLGSIYCVNKEYALKGSNSECNWIKVSSDDNTYGGITFFEAIAASDEQQTVRGFGIITSDNGYISYPGTHFLLNMDKITYFAEPPIEQIIMYNIVYDQTSFTESTNPIQMSATMIENYSNLTQTITRSIAVTKSETYSHTYSTVTQQQVKVVTQGSCTSTLFFWNRHCSSSSTHMKDGPASGSEGTASSNTTLKTDTIEVPVTLPPLSKIQAVITADEHTGNVPYSADTKKIYYDGTYSYGTMKGFYTGVTVREINLQYGKVISLMGENPPKYA